MWRSHPNPSAENQIVFLVNSCNKLLLIINSERTDQNGIFFVRRIEIKRVATESHFFTFSFYQTDLLINVQKPKCYRSNWSLFTHDCINFPSSFHSKTIIKWHGLTVIDRWVQIEWKIDDNCCFFFHACKHLRDLLKSQLNWNSLQNSLKEKKKIAAKEEHKRTRALISIPKKNYLSQFKVTLQTHFKW